MKKVQIKQGGEEKTNSNKKCGINKIDIKRDKRR